MEKPLHVRVAVALGWTECEPGGIMLPGNHEGFPPGPRVIGQLKQSVPRFDIDWETTGPLIERYGINLSFNGRVWHADVLVDRWGPTCDHVCSNVYPFRDCDDHSDHPLKSACMAILALKEAAA